MIRALDIIPILKELGEVDVLVSGIQADIQLPFEVKYRLHGLSFIFGKSGGVDLWRTFLSSTVRKFVQEINSYLFNNMILLLTILNQYQLGLVSPKNFHVLG